MKEKREVETVLRAWKLRKPSAQIHERLFGMSAAAQPAGTAIEDSGGQLAFRWLVPATAGLLLLCLLTNPRGSQGLVSSTNNGPIVAMILSNQSAMAYLPGSFKADQNNVPADTFEWTNVSGSNSSIRSPSSRRGTNRDER